VYHLPVRFVYVGRYEERKGVKNLNAALLHLIRQNQKFEFHFIGDIPTHLQINDSKITYYGAITDYSKIQSLLKSMDVLVCPSYSEGMPNVIVEAMASGLTVIATNVGAVSELVNNSTGYLIENNDVSILTNALNTIINTKKEVLQAKKTAALQHIQNFTWEKIIERLIENIKKFSLQH
jgi:glycosyltransferase involved in cell wall biosynthesis